MPDAHTFKFVRRCHIIGFNNRAFVVKGTKAINNQFSQQLEAPSGPIVTQSRFDNGNSSNSPIIVTVLQETHSDGNFTSEQQKAELQLYGKIEQDRTSSIPDDI
ncbi:hypothetical protein AcW1_006650 [Taiwanofungus camphoratus]|nr:hypothetical protein AcW1_006650 [Antrodia cinnamomea]KAI0954893.1 hypothetical protein AcW1_006650 [Antrodia cinnamomea]